MEHVKDPTLRDEISFLGKILGETIREFDGEEAFLIVEELRRLAWDRRIGRDFAESKMTERVSRLDESQIQVATRAFSVFLDMLNLVEDRARVRVLQTRARHAYPEPRTESIRDAISELKDVGKSAEAVQALVDRLHIELVFTAHPTDAKRRSVRGKLTEIRSLMTQRDSATLPDQMDRINRSICREVMKLWQTDFIRPWRPTVMQEVGRGLSIKPVLWAEVPRIAAEVSRALRENYGDSVEPTRPSVTFGSWIGGDRDGHPGVTSEITKETVQWLRREALAFHLNACDAMFHSFSLSHHAEGGLESLRTALSEARETYPVLGDRLEQLPPGELLRKWLSVIRWRLEQTEKATLDIDSSDGFVGRYDSAEDFAGDVSVLAESIAAMAGGELLMDELNAWLAQIDTFGLHLARLDVRQNSTVHSAVIAAVMKQANICEDASKLSDPDLIALLEKTLDQDSCLSAGDPMVDSDNPLVGETIASYRTLHEVIDKFSPAAIGAYVISMTAAPSDVLNVLWLWRQTGDSDATYSGPPIAPLLETIEDLEHGPAILDGMLNIPAYREHVRQHGDRQMIMLGYSDSTKDGGYLSACWALYDAQQQLVNVANQHGVELTFFHGRGGSLGRGGGPAARSILSLPHGTFRGSMRLTEQGEVLADRYDDPAIAHRHLEQVLWSALLAAGDPTGEPPEVWLTTMELAANKSFKAYRELLEQDDFVNFFRTVTPISDIEQLPIGSRPSRRKPDGGLSDLRAIPWVFSWTQSRCLLPAWYGIGAAMTSMVADKEQRKTLRAMYRDWPFFRAMIDNAELALAKSDPGVAGLYAKLAEGEPALVAIADRVEAEFLSSCEAVLALTQRDDLLDGTPWLKESIRVRNRFIDPLNMIQVELLRRSNQVDGDEEQAERLRQLTRLSINGIAAGMRTSG